MQALLTRTFHSQELDEEPDLERTDPLKANTKVEIILRTLEEKHIHLNSVPIKRAFCQQWLRLNHG